MADFLVDASLPRATADLIRAHGNQATDVRDIGLGTAADQDIADHARQHQLAIVSGDKDFGDILRYPPADYHGLVVIRPPDAATVAPLSAVGGAVLERLPGDGQPSWSPGRG